MIASRGAHHAPKLLENLSSMRRAIRSRFHAERRRISRSAARRPFAKGFSELLGFARSSKPLTRAALETGRRRDQIPRTNIPGISLHRWNFHAPARHQRPLFCIRLARWNRVHCGLMHDSVFLRHSLVLQTVTPESCIEQTGHIAWSSLVAQPLLAVLFALLAG